MRTPERKKNKNIWQAKLIRKNRALSYKISKMVAPLKKAVCTGVKSVLVLFLLLAVFFVFYKAFDSFIFNFAEAGRDSSASVFAATGIWLLGAMAVFMLHKQAEQQKNEYIDKAWRTIRETASAKGNEGQIDALETLSLSDANLERLSLSSRFFEGVKLSGAVLSFSDFSESQLSGADFSNTILAEASFKKADFSVANLCGAVFFHTDLTETGFWRANLSKTSFRGAILKNTDFTDAKLNKAKFAGAIISGADFTNADLTGADFSNTDLSEVKNLTQAQLAKAFGNKSTRVPDDLAMPPMK